MKEIIGMIQILPGMGTDTYLKCKYVLLASSMERPNVNAFFKVLFEVADRKRPLLIGMKKGGAE